MKQPVLKRDASGAKRPPLARLELAPPLKSHFGLVRPMEPRSAEAPFDDPDYYFQIKWDGVRILAFLEGGQVRLQNRKGRDRTRQYPELQQLPELVRAKESLLDGEVVVMENGKPSFPRVIQRDFCRQERTIEALSRSLHSTYCLFDILYLDGKDLTDKPLEERMQMLSEIAQTKWPLHLVENFSNGTALYSRVEELELEGVVAKVKNSAYLLGQKSNCWLKIKPRRRLLCVAGGLKLKDGQAAALLLGAFAEGKLRYVGRAGSGLSRGDLATLRQYAAENKTGAPPFIDPPKEKDCLWLQPSLTVIIEYAEWTPDLKLRAPVVVGFSKKPPEDAQL